VASCADLLVNELKSGPLPGIGIATKNGQYSLDLVGRNIFDTIYVTNVGNWSGTGASSATYGDARYYGAHFRANF
jgi:iron complex outermembrane receptor protein